MRQQLRRVPESTPILSIANLRELNSYDLSGAHRAGAPLDDLVLTHLSLVKELRKLNASEETACRMLAEGYSIRDIAREIAVSPRTASRYLAQAKWSIYGLDIDDAMRKEVAA